MLLRRCPISPTWRGSNLRGGRAYHAADAELLQRAAFAALPAGRIGAARIMLHLRSALSPRAFQCCRSGRPIRIEQCGPCPLGGRGRGRGAAFPRGRDAAASPGTDVSCSRFRQDRRLPRRWSVRQWPPPVPCFGWPRRALRRASRRRPRRRELTTRATTEVKKTWMRGRARHDDARQRAGAARSRLNEVQIR